MEKNPENPINHWSMNFGQFEDPLFPVSCWLYATSWSHKLEIAGSNNLFFYKIFVTEFTENIYFYL